MTLGADRALREQQNGEGRRHATALAQRLADAGRVPRPTRLQAARCRIRAVPHCVVTAPSGGHPAGQRDPSPAALLKRHVPSALVERPVQERRVDRDHGVLQAHGIPPRRLACARDADVRKHRSGKARANAPRTVGVQHSRRADRPTFRRRVRFATHVVAEDLGPGPAAATAVAKGAPAGGRRAPAGTWCRQSSSF